MEGAACAKQRLLSISDHMQTIGAAASANPGATHACCMARESVRITPWLCPLAHNRPRQGVVPIAGWREDACGVTRAGEPIPV